MKHKLMLEGYSYRLRPIQVTDAKFIVEVRLEDEQRNSFIHKISPDVATQENWIKDYLKRENDYYFIIENRLDNTQEGLIAFYNIENNKAEWGRWVTKKGSFAAIESVKLLYQIAFEQLGLDELYCDTIIDNKSVVTFHTSIGEKTKEIKKNSVTLEGKTYDTIVQFSDKKHFYSKILPKLDESSFSIYKRMLKKRVGEFKFDHIGVATKSIEKEMRNYSILGYRPVSDFFIDETQGIRGIFIDQEGGPRLELLENLDGSNTLTKQLAVSNKMYHKAYLTGNINNAIDLFKANKGKMISPLSLSTYYKTKICFMLLPNMEMIELIESK